MEDESWKELSEPYERLCWARLHRTPFERPTDAARSLNLRPGTYRNYELPKADGGRWPPLTEVQRIAKKFGVAWPWLLTGQGTPDEAVGELAAIGADVAARLAKVAPEKRDAALLAVEGVLDALSRKTG